MLYDFFRYMTDLEINYWRYLFFLTPPIILFAFKPNPDFEKNLFKIIVVIGLTFIFHVLQTQTTRIQRGESYDACNAEMTRTEEVVPYGKCREFLPAPHLMSKHTIVIYVFHSFLFTGFWLFIWRLTYLKTLREIGKKYKFRWIEHLVITPFYVIIVLLIFGAVASLYT